MCGINGFSFREEGLVKKMNDRVKHRGPDDDGVFVDDNISLGHTRLSILDLSQKGHQPMLNKDNNLVLIFNGEIYNFRELRESLKKLGHEFVSESDSEVVLAAYEEYGRDCLQKFNGIFAFAIWDKSKNELFLARDRVGVKPLYYYNEVGKLIFSSEIKAILDHPIERKLNMEALNIYFRTLYVPAPMTMFEGIKKLEPGSYLIYKNNKVEIKKYWQPTDLSNLTNRQDAVHDIKSLMKDTVRLQMISDRPVGVFLSGGIDSTVITGLASENKKEKLKTFSVGFDIAPEKFSADATLAKKTSKHFGTDHNEFVVTGNDVLENLEDVIYHMDEPVANSTQVATYLLSKHTSKQVPVVLGGDGGDELFGGYERYRLSRLISRFQMLPKHLQKVGLMLLKSKKQEILNKLVLAPGVDRYLGFMAQKESGVGRILKSSVNNIQATSNIFSKYFNESNKDFEKQFMWADVESWLVDESLVRSDKMSMAHGLEQRVPILDYRLVELSKKIPTSWKIKGGTGKSIFREAMKEYIPEYVMNQPKRGWFSPTSEWFRTDLKDMASEVLSPSYNESTRDLFDFDEIQIMLKKHIDKEEYNMNLLWALMTFQIWYHKFLSPPQS